MLGVYEFHLQLFSLPNLTAEAAENTEFFYAFGKMPGGLLN